MRVYDENGWNVGEEKMIVFVTNGLTNLIQFFTLLIF